MQSHEQPEGSRHAEMIVAVDFLIYDDDDKKKMRRKRRKSSRATSKVEFKMLLCLFKYWQTRQFLSIVHILHKKLVFRTMLPADGTRRRPTTRHRMELEI